MCLFGSHDVLVAEARPNVFLRKASFLATKLEGESATRMDHLKYWHRLGQTVRGTLADLE
jgi:hypothetical protein